jgi:hypothetical protein
MPEQLHIDAALRDRVMANAARLSPFAPPMENDGRWGLIKTARGEASGVSSEPTLPLPSRSMCPT